MVAWLGGNHLSPAQRQHVVTQTDGVPLFVEEVTKFVLAAHRLHGSPSGAASAPAAPEVPLPATLRDSLMARLDQLGPAKGTAQLGATMGREFPVALLQAVTPLEEDLLHQDLRQLVEAELLYQRGVGATAVYQFKHALIQEAAYASLLRRTRQHYHQQIAQVLETQFPDTVATQPELLARHYTEAGFHTQAAEYWQRAGQRALGHSAYVEATSHLTTGLEVLTHLPHTSERHQCELDLQLTLALALHASKGQAAPEVEQAYTRARELCGQVEDTPQLFRVLLGLYRFYGGRLQLQTSRELTEQLYSLAQRAQDPDLLLEAHMAQGTIALLLGDLMTARRHLEQAIALYDVQHHHSHALRYSVDPGVISLSRMSWVLWLLGYPDQALRRSQDTLALAQTRAHPHSLASALFFAAMFHQFRREASAAQELAAATVSLATKQGMALELVRGTFLQGWALSTQGRGADGLVQMRQGLTDYQATGTMLDLPWYLGALAEAYGSTNRIDAGLDTIAEALTIADKAGYYEAELYRLKGELLRQHTVSNVFQVEACLQQALDIACRQQAKSLELRAAMSLARLWQQQGKRTAARELLAPIYGWFSEGFETADLQEAKALLGQLVW
jgi:predicted ATPase